MATVGANLAHGLGHGPVGALVSAWPALALVGSFELLMLLIMKRHQAGASHEYDAGCLADGSTASHAGPALARAESTLAHPAPALEQQVRDLHRSGHSQRSIAAHLNIGRRKVKQIIDIEAA